MKLRYPLKVRDATVSPTPLVVDFQRPGSRYHTRAQGKRPNGGKAAEELESSSSQNNEERQE